MPPPSTDHLAYRRSRFQTRLPRDRHYTRGHHWLALEPERPAAQTAETEGRIVRVGFTRFATRMLGEIVEMEFESRAGDRVEVGQTVGWFEGFKAVSDLYAPVSGTFVAANPDLDAVAERIHKEPYGDGWLYRVALEPGAALPDDALTAEEYAGFLDGTIDRMMGGS